MMPSEPDKKMEDLLRTYARKRREDAGEPLEMHPATRRLLQAEAARLRPREAASQRTLWNWLLLHWPRVAFAVGLITLLAVAVWNGIPDRDQSSSPSLFAKREQQDKAVSQAPVPGRDGIAAPEAQLGDVAEQDKDRAKRLQAEALKPTERSLDEFRVGNSLREPSAQADVKLKNESEGLGMNFQKTPAGGVKSAEAEASAGVTEQQLLVRKVDPGTTTTRLAAGQAASRLEPPTTNALSFGANLALAPGADPTGKQRGFTYSTPGGAAESYSKPPLAQASPVTNAVPFFEFAGGPSRSAERQATDFSRIPAPAAHSPNTSAVLAFDSRNYEFKRGRADLGVETRDGAAGLSLGERSQTRARATGAGGVLLAKEATQPSTLPKQSYRFQRQAGVEKPVAAKAVMESAPAGVLATFDIEEDGDRVRVIDSDGSVYSGRFVSGAEIGQARFAEIGEALNRSVPAGTEPSRQASTAEGARRYSIVAGSSSPTTNRFFRANGTNRTSGQLVTIEASLSGGSDALATGASRGLSPPGTTPALGGPAAAEPGSKTAAPSPTSAARIASGVRESRRLVGLVRIGASNEAKLIAVPVAK